MRWELPRRVVAAVEVALQLRLTRFLFAPRNKVVSPHGTACVELAPSLPARGSMLKRFCLFVHHTDAQREWVYDRQSSIGRLDKGLDEARAKGWTVVDMQRDWKVVFPFERK